MRGTPGARILGAAFAALFAGALFAAETDERIRAAFGEFDGCALVLSQDRHHEKRLEFGLAQCALPQSPCSTFKIPHSLIGLQTGLLTGPDHLKPWDGVERWRAAWNQDQTLASAMAESAVWYYQDLARDIGMERMNAWLQRLEYGNADPSSGVDTFWLSGSLQIDAHGQLAFLRSLTHGTLPIRPAHQATVRSLLQQNSDLSGQLHGKTGSCLGDVEAGTQDHGWYVGWLAHGSTSNPATTWFVVNIRGEGGTGQKARPIALELINLTLNTD